MLLEVIITSFCNGTVEYEIDFKKHGANITFNYEKQF